VPFDADVGDDDAVELVLPDGDGLLLLVGEDVGELDVDEDVGEDVGELDVDEDVGEDVGELDEDVGDDVGELDEDVGDDVGELDEDVGDDVGELDEDVGDDRLLVCVISEYELTVKFCAVPAVEQISQP
jgi:hypothetical protein